MAKVRLREPPQARTELEEDDLECGHAWMKYRSKPASARVLHALENEEWPKLPGGVFGRGFVRTHRLAIWAYSEKVCLRICLGAW